jgi:predicted transcriptional regulator
MEVNPVDIKISDSELEVMRILWREKRPLKVSEFRDELETAQRLE